MFEYPVFKRSRTVPRNLATLVARGSVKEERKNMANDVQKLNNAKKIKTMNFIKKELRINEVPLKLLSLFPDFPCLYENLQKMA